MRIATFFLFLGLFLQVQAQMKQPDPTVFIFVGDSIFPMNVITSQTELKKGWDIQGINVGRKKDEASAICRPLNLKTATIPVWN